MPQPMQSQPIDPSLFAPRNDTVVVWLGMAGVMINTRGTVLLIDPLLTSVQRAPGVEDAETGHHMKLPWPIRARDVPRADAVLYTHSDGDHFGRTTAQTLGVRLSPRFVAPRPVLAWLEEMALSVPLLEAREGQTIDIGPARVEITPALHDYPADYPFSRADCCGYLIHTPDGVIWHPGDTRLIDDLRRYRCDVLFFDLADVDAHLGPRGSAELARTSGAKIVVPYHYATFDMPPGSWGGCRLEDALPLMQGMPTKIAALEPGEPLRLPL